jgi:hypothetical protein
LEYVSEGDKGVDRMKPKMWSKFFDTPLETMYTLYAIMAWLGKGNINSKLFQLEFI